LWYHAPLRRFTGRGVPVDWLDEPENSPETQNIAMAKSSKKKMPPPQSQSQQKSGDPSRSLEVTRSFRWRDRRDWIHVGIVLGVALLLRLVYYYLNQKNNPVFLSPIMDALFHHEWAQQILDGTASADDVFFRGPLYPYLLAFLYKISGSSISFALFVQHLIGTATAGLVYLLAREYFNPRVSLLAGLLAALYWPFVYFEGDLLIVTTILFLNTLGLLLLGRAVRLRSFALLAAAGLVLGLSAIARPSILIFFPALPLVLYWNRDKSDRLRRDWLKRSAVVTAGIVAVILPVMIRNYQVGRAVVPIAASGGVNFYIGNNPQSDGSTAIVPGTRADWWGGYYDAIAIAETAEGRKLKLNEVSDYFFRRGMAWIQARPDAAAEHFLYKFKIFWSGPERANNKFIYFFWNLAGMKYVPLPGFWLIAPLAILGGILQWRRRRKLSALYLFVLLYMAGVVAFFVNARFRLPVMPVLIVFAAYAVHYLILTFRQKDFRAIRAAIILAVAILLVNIDYMAFAQVRAYSTAFSHCTLGNTYMKTGHRETALNHYERAWQLNEENPTEAFELIARDITYNMGLLYWERGLCSRAISALKKVGMSYDGTADIYTLNALDWLGECYLKKSQPTEARDVYKEFMRLAPDDDRAVAGMARVYASVGDLETAERMLKSVVDPTAAVHVPAYIALAEVQRDLGKTDEAIESFKMISKYAGYEKEGLVKLAELYQKTGDIDAAIETLQQAIVYFPPGDQTVRNWIKELESMN
jgi:4-amino-4-deoxy-L-arabinose transferase-like glycosyltransferase/TolA-binding protein